MQALKGGGKAFGRGFCGCLGAWVATLLLIIPLILIIIFIAGRVLVPAIAGFLEGLPGQIEPLLSPLESLQPFMGPGGPPGGPGPSAIPPTPTGELPRIEVWLTAENDPDAQRLTTIRAGEAPEVFYLWAKGLEGVSVTFQLWLTVPNGMRQQMGPNFVTDPSGEAVSCGTSGGPPPGPGTYKVEALIGETVVGSTTLEVTSE